MEYQERSAKKEFYSYKSALDLIQIIWNIYV